MSQGSPPVGAQVVDFRPGPQLVRALKHGDEIRFELQLSPGHDGSALQDGFYFTLEAALRRPGGDVPIATHCDDSDPTKLHVTYTLRPDRNIAGDRQAILGTFADLNVPITQAVIDGMSQLFDPLVKKQEEERFAAGVEARRSESTKPRGGHSR